MIVTMLVCVMKMFINHVFVVCFILIMIFNYSDSMITRVRENHRLWTLLHTLALLFLLFRLDCWMEYFLVADFWKLWVNLVHCCTAELAVCENEFPVLEAQRLDSGSDGLKHNSNKSTTGGMIPGSFTPTILPDAYFDILSSSPTISFSYTSL